MVKKLWSQWSDLLLSSDEEEIHHIELNHQTDFEGDPEDAQSHKKVSRTFSFKYIFRSLIRDELLCPWGAYVVSFTQIGTGRKLSSGRKIIHSC